jgi:hypothetical protein
MLFDLWSPSAGANHVFILRRIKPSTEAGWPRPRRRIVASAVVDENPASAHGIWDVGNIFLDALGWHGSPQGRAQEAFVVPRILHHSRG